MQHAFVDGESSGRDEVLLQRYRRSPSVKLRNLLIERYRAPVEEVARGVLSRVPKSVDLQDLIHAGIWGLMQALDNYRPERGRSFLPFMRIRVRGAMLDELRNMDYLPRLYRSRMRQREQVNNRLRETLQREPTDAELAAELGVSEDRLRRQYSLPAPGTGNELVRDNGNPEEIIERLVDANQEAPIEAVNRRELIEKIESSLQPVEWAVLRLHYLEGMSGKEVARSLRLSASRICQIHMRVLSRLKTRLSSSAT